MVLPALALLVLAQGDDARLAAVASLDAPRVTYAELGEWVQRATGVPVLVAHAIRERKATVLVDARPVRETMDRVADALFLEWERTPSGYTLRLQPKVAAEEDAANDAVAQARAQTLRGRLDELAALAGKSATSLAEMRDDAQKAADAPHAGVAAFERLARLKEAADRPELVAVGGVLAALGEGGRARLADGGRAFALSRPTPDTLPIPAISLPGLLRGRPPGGLVGLMLTGDPDRETLRASTVLFGGTGNGGDTFGVGAVARQSIQGVRLATALQKRLLAWAATDDGSLGETPIAPVQPTALKPRRSLADLLVDLHRRTGLPIVADGFREPFRDGGEIVGTRLWEWLGALNRPTSGVPLVPLLWRESKGWLALRRQYYAEQLPREIPERTIRPFEAAARTRGATLDDAATLVAALTPAQAAALDDLPPVMDGPADAFPNNVAILRAWAALPPGARRAAEGRAGLPLEPGAAGRDETFEALAQRCAQTDDPDLVALLFPGVPFAVAPRLRVERQGERRTVLDLTAPDKELAFFVVPLPAKPAP